MTWLPIALLAVLAMAAALVLFRLPPGGREAFGAVLLLGIAGYALQGHPGLAGSPTTPREPVANVEVQPPPPPTTGRGTQWMVIANAMARHGQFGAAAGVLRGAVAKDPGNGEAWLAMANALVAHADGQLSPAALYAFGKAEAAEPDSPGPPLFLGLALAQSGRLAEGRKVWADLLARSPADAPWRQDLTDRLAQLDAFIAEREGASNPPR